MSDEQEETGTESAVERAKRESHQLRGTLAETLADPAATHFGKDDQVLLKFHGSYQQDDRDQRQHRGEVKAKAYSFMIRVAIPGGSISASQYLAFDDLATKYANETIRLTTRQGIQYHGVVKDNLKATIAEINDALVTTISACGDVQRNVMACSAPLANAAHRAVRDAAQKVSDALRPKSRAYFEIWLDGERVELQKDAIEEPFYGAQYLPRKFKSVVALDTDNCVDAYSHDAALIAITDGDAIRGFNVVVGGGLGMTHNKADTMAAMGQLLGFVAVDDAVESVRTIAAIYRDHGNRADRRHARVKYLLAEWGMDRFRAEFKSRVAFPVHEPAPMPATQGHDHLGLHKADDGTMFMGVFVQSGRIVDTDTYKLRTALREIVKRVQPGVVITAQQNLLFTGLSQESVATIEQIMREHGVTPAEELIPLRRHSMACPALPTCSLAVAESERAIPDLLNDLEAEFRSLGIQDAPLTVRMTGCPNGCARPYTADLAFVGRSLELYQIYVGGAIAGDRVGDLFLDKVTRANIVPALRPLLTRFAAERGTDESFGDYYQRLSGKSEPRRFITGREVPSAPAMGSRRCDVVSRSTRHVLLLAAHGSSSDALVIERVQEHARQLAALVPHDEVRVGFARGTPSLRNVVSDLAAQDATLTVVPFMMSAGHYADRVMPGLLRESLGDSRMHITKPVGASARIAGVLHRRALRIAARERWALNETAIVLIGHGTKRHSASRDSAFAHVRKLALHGWSSVAAAFIDDEPGIEAVVTSMVEQQVIVLPFLIGGASHAAIDVPTALGMPVDDTERARYAVIGNRAMVLDEPLGVDGALTEIAAMLAVRAWPRVTSKPLIKTGRVYLVGAGPGAADLLTVRARRLLQRADVVVYDRLVSPDVLALARADARLVDAGKFPDTPQDTQLVINAQIVRFAQEGARVVRLKGGDPFVFGRGSEEVDACHDAGVRVEVVPGLSSALVAPMVAGISLTTRNVSRGFAVVSAATATDTNGLAMHVRDYARIDTLVVLMGRARLADVCRQLVAEGRAAETPVACIERATLPGERTIRGTLLTIAAIADEAQLQSPMVAVIGEVARERDAEM